jgi:hypothetical protein
MQKLRTLVNWKSTMRNLRDSKSEFRMNGLGTMYECFICGKVVSPKDVDQHECNELEIREDFDYFGEAGLWD